jgi:hypothetical protein
MHLRVDEKIVKGRKEEEKNMTSGPVRNLKYLDGTSWPVPSEG